MATHQREVIHTMSTIREVLFKVERTSFDPSGESEDSVLFASTSFDRAMQWARDKFGKASADITIVSYADADDFGFTWLGEIAPCLLWRNVWGVEGRFLATNMTASEERYANDMQEWIDECAAAASWIA
jgi:hypothetical protein